MALTFRHSLVERQRRSSWKFAEASRDADLHAGTGRLLELLGTIYPPVVVYLEINAWHEGRGTFLLRQYLVFEVVVRRPAKSQY